MNTEIGVRFSAEGAARTRVELKHRRLNRCGAHRDRMRTVFETEGDWGRLLAMFAAVAKTRRD